MMTLLDDALKTDAEAFRPTGHSLRWTAGEIAMLAATDPARRTLARTFLRAIGYPEGTADRDGRWILLLLLFLAARLAQLARRMSRGALSIGDWQRATYLTVAAGYLAAWAVGRAVPVSGITDDLADLADVEADVRFALARLERFARTLEAGISVTVTEDAAAARAALYGRYATAIYERGKRKWAKSRGLLLERNVLGDAEHCVECVAATARGWVPLGTLPLPGTRLCMGNCKCRLDYDAADA